MEKYAILISGGVNTTSNYKRYQNDLGYAHEVLVNKLGYELNNIRVLYANGKVINYQNATIKTECADRENVINSLRNLTLTKCDNLFIMVSNHGGDDNEGFVNLWGKEVITLLEITSLLNEVCCNKIVVMGQCYGGNILKYQHDNTCIITANEENHLSYGRLENNYNEFIYHFVSYFNGCYPDGKPLKIQSSENNVEKAYNYAKVHDRYNPQNPGYKALIDYVKQTNPNLASGLREIPQYKNTMDSKSIIML